MAAKMVLVRDLKVGNILADAVLSGSGKILLGKNMVLTARHISLLNSWNVQCVFIETDEEQPLDKSSQETVTKTASPEVTSTDYVKFIKEYNSIVKNTIQNFDLIREQKIIPVAHLKDTAGDIHLSIVNNSFEIMNYLLSSDPKLVDYIPRHSVMVAYLAEIIARQLRWGEEDIAGVVLAGLLHDVGNLVADKVDNPRAQAHIAEAAGLLRRTKGLSHEVILGIIQHRERMNGNKSSGTMTGTTIHPYAKIIAVADFFHNLTCTNKYSNPFPVLDMIVSEMFGKLDPDMCMAFISRVKDSLLFNKVLLSNGQEAEVIFFHPNCYGLPIVRTADQQIIDLAQQTGLTIQRIVTSRQLGDLV